MGLGRICTYPKHCRMLDLKVSMAVAEPATLECSNGCIVFRVKKQHEMAVPQKGTAVYLLPIL